MWFFVPYQWKHLLNLLFSVEKKKKIQPVNHIYLQRNSIVCQAWMEEGLENEILVLSSITGSHEEPGAGTARSSVASCV